MSKSKLRSAKYSINESIKQIKGYSYASQADMRHMLTRCIKDLHEQGYAVAHIKGLKPKHIHVLVELWKKQGKNTATIKNYMSKLRKVAVLLDKPQLVKSDNDAYHIAQRSYAPTHNKAIYQVDFTKCTDPLIRLSLEAQLLFGLRREESMKLIVSDAWQGDHLKIKPSWTKGGIGRTIQITNNEQRIWLLTAIKQMGLSKCHGLRHAFAQQRYHELTRQFDPQNKGLLCPIEGGKPTRSLNKSERAIDRRAREIISSQLGHSRSAILKIYIG